MKISACIDMMFSYCDFYERFAEVKNCGINTIEFWKWTNKDIDRVIESGMDVSIFNIDSSDEKLSTGFSLVLGRLILSTLRSLVKPRI